jgi:hypothetical protein
MKSIQAFLLDHHQEENKPVIRIFGRLPEGSSICLHVENCFPYLLIDFPHPLEEYSDYRHLLESSLNLALQKEDAIRLCLLVRGTRFYGWAKESLFIKIYYRNPAMKTQLCLHLQSGLFLSF